MKRFFSEFRMYFCNRIIANIPSHTIRLWFYRSIMQFKIADKSYILMNCFFDCKGNFSMGRNSVITANCRMDTRGGIEIGANVSISNDVIVLTADHDMNTPDFHPRLNGVRIEDYVWIGTRAMILPGVQIGKGSIIAAGAIVTKNVDAFAVVAGIPAKKVKERSQEEFTYQLNYRRLFH